MAFWPQNFRVQCAVNKSAHFLDHLFHRLRCSVRRPLLYSYEAHAKGRTTRVNFYKWRRCRQSRLHDCDRPLPVHLHLVRRLLAVRYSKANARLNPVALPREAAEVVRKT